MRNIVAMLTILLIATALSMASVDTAHAATMTGTFTWDWTNGGTSTLSNGTAVLSAKSIFAYEGPFSGTSNATEKAYFHPDQSGSIAMVETFTGSFNGSKHGSIVFQGVGYFEGPGEYHYVAVSFSDGTGGLAGLQGTFSKGTTGVWNCNFSGSSCTVQGTYTVTSAMWSSPVPEFSSLALVILFASGVCLTMLRRKRAA
jgi:hypothetical protein